MAALSGKDGTLTLTNQSWKIHAWQVQKSRRVFDYTGDTDTVVNYFLGDQTARGIMEVTLNDSSANSNAGRKLPQPSNTVVVAAFVTISGTTYTSDILITDSEWIVEKRGGGPPQRARISFVTHDNDSGSLLNPA